MLNCGGGGVKQEMGYGCFEKGEYSGFVGEKYLENRMVMGVLSLLADSSSLMQDSTNNLLELLPSQLEIALLHFPLALA